MKKLLAFLVILVLLGAAGVGYVAVRPYSAGERTGIVRKTSRHGWLCKTWESELLMAMGSNQGAVLYGEVWYFSIRDPAVVAQVQEADRNRRPVTLFYEQYRVYNPCQQESEYVVVGVHDEKGNP